MRVKEYLRRKVAFFASVIEIAISIIVPVSYTHLTLPTTPYV